MCEYGVYDYGRLEFSAEVISNLDHSVKIRAC